MERIPENEQWKLSGNCNKCRRKNYCQTLCTKAKWQERNIVHELVKGKLNELTGGAIEIVNSNMRRYEEIT